MKTVTEWFDEYSESHQNKTNKLIHWFCVPTILFSIIGIIMLMGLVTKNAILLIDFIKKAMEDGISRYDAILQAGKTRLRPILMTTSAMVMGMVPLALGLGEGGEQSAPMAHAVIGGVITSTLLTLVVVPVIFTYLDDLKNFMLRQTRRFMS